MATVLYNFVDFLVPKFGTYTKVAVLNVIIEDPITAKYVICLIFPFIRAIFHFFILEAL